MGKNFLSIMTSSQKRVTYLITLCMGISCAVHDAANNFSFGLVIEGGKDSSYDVLLGWKGFGREVDGTGNISIAT